MQRHGMAAVAAMAPTAAHPELLLLLCSRPQSHLAAVQVHNLTTQPGPAAAASVVRLFADQLQPCTVLSNGKMGPAQGLAP